MTDGNQLPVTPGTPIILSTGGNSTTPSSTGEAQPGAEQPGKPSWQEQAIWDLANTDMSYAEIGRKYDRASSTIVKLKKIGRVVRPAKKRVGPRPALDAEIISPVHRAMATRVRLHIDSHPDQDPSVVFGLSRMVLKRLRHGSFDPTLVQLQRISQVLGMTVAQLLEPERAVTVRRVSRG